MATTAPSDELRGPEAPGRGRSQPQRAKVPARRPMTTATRAKGAA